MSIIQLSSIDTNFGHIIKKNPNSEMQLRPIRKGMAFGWYTENGINYNIYFKDGDNVVSFGDGEFEYLNKSKYNSSMFVLNAISDFFSSTVKEEISIDTISEKSFMINMIHIKNISQLKQFEKYFTDFKLEYEVYADKSYKLIIKTDKSWHLLLNYVNLLMLFITLTGDEYFNFDTESINKYMNSIERLDPPFFIRYMFSRHMLKGKKIFNEYKSKLEKTTQYNSINMAYGDTAMQRRNEIEKLINFDKPIVDIGCGEGFYAIPFSQKIDKFNYHAIDIDLNLLTIVNNKAEKKEIKNITTYNRVANFLENYTKEEVDVILTEVIEHMPQNDSIELLTTIFENINFKKMVITVPNQEFNQFYLIEDGKFRHNDHKWEPKENEFHEFMNKIIPNHFKYEFIKIGDMVNKIHTSIGCVITKEEKFFNEGFNCRTNY
jgi:SAM-dependent methyltransferase